MASFATSLPKVSSATTTVSTSVQEMKQKREAELRKVHDNYAFNKMFLNVPERATPTPIVTTTSSLLPRDFPPGAFLRVGPMGAAKQEGFSGATIADKSLLSNTNGANSCTGSGVEVMEFPTLPEQYNGRPYNSFYCNHMKSIGGPLYIHKLPHLGVTLAGVCKVDCDTGVILAKYNAPEHWNTVSEPTIVPKQRQRQHDSSSKNENDVGELSL